MLGFNTNHNVLLLAGDGRYLQATPDPAGLIYYNHTPITVVQRETKYSTSFGFGDQSIGRFTGSDVWQAKPSLTVNNRFSYMCRNLSILRNGDGGSIVDSALTGRQLRNQHDVVNDFDYEGEPVLTFHTGSVHHTLLTGVEVQHQTVVANRSTADLQNITNIFDPVIPETSRAGLVFLRDAKHSGFSISCTRPTKAYMQPTRSISPHDGSCASVGASSGGRRRLLRRSLSPAAASGMGC